MEEVVKNSTLKNDDDDMIHQYEKRLVTTLLVRRHISLVQNSQTKSMIFFFFLLVDVSAWEWIADIVNKIAKITLKQIKLISDQIEKIQRKQRNAGNMRTRLRNYHYNDSRNKIINTEKTNETIILIN